MSRKDPNVWSVQLSDRCLHAAKIDVRVPIKTKFFPDRKQNPRAFFAGRGVVRMVDDTVVITAR